MYLKQKEYKTADKAVFIAGTQPETSSEVMTSVLIAPPWKVIVWDDPVNLANYVVWVFQKTFGYSEPRARALMEKIHFTGKAAVWSGDRERAEMYVQRMHCYQLSATLERDE